MMEGFQMPPAQTGEEAVRMECMHIPPTQQRVVLSMHN